MLSGAILSRSTLYSVWRDDFHKKSQIEKKNKFRFILIHLIILLCYYCSLGLKMQSKHSVLCPDTSSLVVPTFDTKVTE